jgi:hypothetical protein
MIHAFGVSATTAAVWAAIIAAAIAQSAWPWNTKDCPERTIYNWCASVAQAAGWQLKYQNDTSPSWHMELWVRGREARLCEFRADGARVLDNLCQVLEEVGE